MGCLFRLSPLVLSPRYRQAALLGSLQRLAMHLAGIMQSVPPAVAPQDSPSLAKAEQMPSVPINSHLPAEQRISSPDFKPQVEPAAAILML
jgi:hypothetical protein